MAVGPWWTTDADTEIDAVVLAEPDRRRVPVMVGEAKWARRVDASRVTASLVARAARLTPEAAGLRLAVCARAEVSHAGPATLAVTAADIFGNVQSA